MERYYVRWSSIFDTRSYDIELLKKAVKNGGGENIHTSRLFGWSNQPEVVTFDCNDIKDVKNVKTSIQNELNTEWIIVSLKDW